MDRLILTTVFMFNLLMVAHSQILIEGFEDWKDSLSAEYLSNWDVFPEIDTVLLNLEKVDHLNEGLRAVKLKSNIPHFEGNFSTQIWKELPVYTDVLNIKFTCKCEGEGKCTLILGQGKIGSTETNLRIVWEIDAGDTSTYTIVIDSISINPPFEVFKIISFVANPIITSSGSYGINHFTIDSLVVGDGNSTTNIKSVPSKNNFKIYPNPASDKIHISMSRMFRSCTISVFNIIGNRIYMEQKNNTDLVILDASKYPSGSYIISILTEIGIESKKLIVK